jgi:hypothetical protein
MHTYHVHYPQTYERSRRRAPLHCFSTPPRSMLICLASRDLYSPADLIGPQHVVVIVQAQRGAPFRLRRRPTVGAWGAVDFLGSSKFHCPLICPNRDRVSIYLGSYI